MKLNETLKNSAVITTKKIFLYHAPILYVFHDEDNIWECEGEEYAKDSDYMVVSFEEICALDRTLLEVINLKAGFYAYRTDKNSDWQFLPLDNE